MVPRMAIEIDDELFEFLRQSMDRKGVDVRLSEDLSELIYTSRKTGETITSPSKLVWKD